MAGWVDDAWGTSVLLTGGASCLAQLYGEPVFCGATVSSIVVDVGSGPVPPYAALVDVYGLTAPDGGITPLEIAVRP